MENKIEFENRALRDLDNYYDYYEERASGMGDKFREAVDQHIAVLQKLPSMNVRYDGIRCTPIIGFPFMLHYSFIPQRNVVRIHAVIHTSRNPLSNWNDLGWIVSEPVVAYGKWVYEREYYLVA